MKKLLPLTALVVLISTGCSTGGDDTAASTDNRTAAVTFSQCMRDHGVKNFPDPDASGELTADAVANNSRIDTSGPTWDKAIAACKDLQPAGFTGTKRSPEQQAASLQFAQCIREHGVPDFPDPDPNGPMVDTNRIPSSNKPGGMAALNAAMDTCGTFAEQAGVGK